MRKRSKLLHTLIVLAMGMLLSGFASQGNPLIGTWSCNTQETMKEMDTSNLSDMEKQMYAQYLKAIKLNVTKEKMILKKMTGTETSKYEILNKNDNKVVVRYIEEDEKDNFNLLQENKMSWTLNTDQGDVRCILERQD